MGKTCSAKVARFTMKPATREALFGYAFVLPWILGFIGLSLGPMLAAFGISLFETDFLTHTNYVGLTWWRRLFGDRLVVKSFLNTAYFVVGSVPLRTAFALMIAVLLNQGMVGQSVWRTIYYLPSVVSGVAVSVLFRWLYQPEAGLINGMLAWFGIQGPRWIYSQDWAMPSIILMSLWGSGSAMLIYLAALRGIPTALYESAKIDGAGPIRQFFSITIPMLSPTILFNSVMNLIGAWQVFQQALVMTEGGPNDATLTVVLNIYRTGFERRFFGYASAQAGFLFIVIVAVMALAFSGSRRWVFYERV